jgi:putative sigma-54 modulation protein
MKLNITGRHFEITPAIKSYLEEKLGKLDKYGNDIISVNVILDIEKYGNIVETNLTLKRSHVNIKERDKNMYSAIDKAFARIKKILIRHEDKIKTHRHKIIEEK